MAIRPVRLRALASADIERAADYDVREAGTVVATRFVDAIEIAVGRIGRSPQSGSLRFAYELEIPGLRVRSVPRFPYLVFYVVGEEVIDVWRVPHTRRDLPAALADG